MLTIDEVQTAIPSHLKVRVSQHMVDELNKLDADPQYADTMQKNFITYATVLNDGRFRLEDYVAAVKYCTFKMMGFNNKESYQRTFPKRYKRLVSEGKTEKEISTYVVAFNKNKMVTSIMEQSVIPIWIMNQHVLQQAISTQADLMMNAKSEKVRQDAANSLLVHLKKPESKDVNLNIGVKYDDGMSALREKLTEMAQLQQDMIEKGVSTKQIAHDTIIDVTPVSKSIAAE